MNTKEIIDMDTEYIMNTYGRQPIALVKGKGSIVWDAEGKSYIDCVAGIAVNNVGHANSKVVEAICKQAQNLIHTSNLYYTEEQATLAKLLSEISVHEKSFFCNSGAEANEGAIKLARKCTGKGEIIAMENSFHGRTITTITATGQPKYQKGFGPLTPGFKHVPYNNLEAVREAIGLWLLLGTYGLLAWVAHRWSRTNPFAETEWNLSPFRRGLVWGTAATLLVLAVLLSPGGGSPPFIYFQF